MARTGCVIWQKGGRRSELKNTHIERVPFPVAEVQVGRAQQIGGVFPTGATTRRARRVHKVGILTTLACAKKKHERRKQPWAKDGSVWLETSAQRMGRDGTCDSTHPFIDGEIRKV